MLGPLVPQLLRVNDSLSWPFKCEAFIRDALAAEEVLMAETASNESDDEDPAGRGYNVSWKGARGSTDNWSGRSQSKEVTAKEEMGGGAGVPGWVAATAPICVQASPRTLSARCIFSLFQPASFFPASTSKPQSSASTKETCCEAWVTPLLPLTWISLILHCRCTLGPPIISS